MPTYRLLLSDWRDRETYADHKVGLRAWVERHLAEIEHRFPARFATRNALVVKGAPEILADLPVGITAAEIPDLAATRVLLATVPTRGTRHFAPGTTVYPHGRHSGDGYQRVYVTGLDKETARLVTMMCLALRFEAWRVELVTDVRVVFALREHGVSWAVRPGAESEEEMRAIASSMNARVAGQTR